MNESEFTPPQNRECERCGRRDIWDDTSASWRIEGKNSDGQPDRPYCIHEWDVDGTYNPFGAE